MKKEVIKIIKYALEYSKEMDAETNTGESSSVCVAPLYSLSNADDEGYSKLNKALIDGAYNEDILKFCPRFMTAEIYSDGKYAKSYFRKCIVVELRDISEVYVIPRVFSAYESFIDELDELFSEDFEGTRIYEHGNELHHVSISIDDSVLEVDSEIVRIHFLDTILASGVLNKTYDSPFIKDRSWLEINIKTFKYNYENKTLDIEFKLNEVQED